MSPEAETCEIVWWRGYVTGRFQALTHTSEGMRLIGESPTVAWRSTTPPGPTEAAVAALDVLTATLADAGWQVTKRDEEMWSGLTLSRPVPVGRRPSSDDAVIPNEKRVPAVPERRQEPQALSTLDAALLEQLQADLALARDEARRERARRIEVEAEAIALHRAGPSEAPRRGAAGPPPPAVLVAAYSIAVAAAFVVGLVGFESLYAGVVAALTTCAVSVAIDGWLVVRRRVAAAR